MKFQTVAKIAASAAIALTLVACGGTPSSLSQETLDEVSGVKVSATNATEEHVTYTEGAITVKENDTIVISPDLEKGSLHVLIESSDGTNVVFDDDVSGRVLFTVSATPGVYDVTVSGIDGTGDMTIFAQSQGELAAQNEALTEAMPEGTLPEELTTSE